MLSHPVKLWHLDVGLVLMIAFQQNSLTAPLSEDLSKSLLYLKHFCFIVGGVFLLIGTLRIVLPLVCNSKFSALRLLYGFVHLCNTNPSSIRASLSILCRFAAQPLVGYFSIDSG